MKTLRNFGYFNILIGFPLFYLSFFFWFLLLIPFGLILVILAWIFRQRPLLSTGWQTALGLAPSLAISTFVIVGGIWQNRPFRQTILVPAGYRGLVVIGYGVPTGQPKVWEEGGRLIRVSNRGVAATQFDTGDEGWLAPENDKVYEISTGGKRTLLPELEGQIAYPDNQVGIHHSYLDSKANTVIFIVSRKDSLKYFLEPGTFILNKFYRKKAEAIENGLNRI